MAVDNTNRRFEGQSSFLGGVDSNLKPRMLNEAQVAWATNATFRGGSAGPRPALAKRTLTFATGTGSSTWSDLTRKFQGAGYFRGADGAGYIQVALGGRLFRIDPRYNFQVNNYFPDNEVVFNPDSDIVTFNQAEQWSIAQDGKAQARILTQDSGSVADTFRNVRTGLMSRYVNGRIWTAIKTDYDAGDLVGSSSGTSAFKRKDAILQRTENQYLNEGGTFSVPADSGEITGIIPVHSLDTAVGDGDLLILTESAVFATQVPSDRTTWADLTYPIQRLVLPHGCVGPFSPVSINNDVWFRSVDGVRSLLSARRDFQSPGNHVLSTEVNRALSNDIEPLLRHSSSIYFDNRLLMTVGANKQSRGVTHGGIISLDFNPQNNLRGAVPPVWEGVWSGLDFLHLVTGKFEGQTRAFVFALVTRSNLATIELWEILPEESQDRDGTTCLPIDWYLETRAVHFGSPWERKKITDMETWWTNLRDDVTVTAYYRPDSDPTWRTWHSWTEDNTFSITSSDVDSEGCLLFPNYKEGYRPRRSIAHPPPSNETLVDPCKPTTHGFTFQFRLQIQGYAKLDLVRWFANIEEEAHQPPCPPATAVTTSDNTCPALTELPTITIS